MKIGQRHHLRNDEVRRISDHLESALGVTLDAETFEHVELEDSDFDLVLIDGKPLVFLLDETPFLTVEGANGLEPAGRIVTVDAGAVSFVSDGADIMRPGIVEADPDIEPDDLVLIAEESHGKILAVGRALVSGEEMVGDSGKVIKSVHHVGDDLYQLAP